MNLPLWFDLLCLFAYSVALAFCAYRAGFKSGVDEGLLQTLEVIEETNLPDAETLGDLLISPANRARLNIEAPQNPSLNGS